MKDLYPNLLKKRKRPCTSHVLNTNFLHNKICSSIEYKNIFATQFHPEKSGDDGIKIYQNFIDYLKI